MKRFAALCRNLQALVLAVLAGSAGTQAQVPPDPDTAAWEAARTAGTAEACQRYLEAFPVGRYAEEAFRCIVEETLPAAGPPAAAARRGETGCDEVGGAACVVIPELPAPAAGPARPAPAPPAPTAGPAPVPPAQAPGAPDAASEPMAPEQVTPAPAADPAPVAPDQVSPAPAADPAPTGLDPVPSPPAAELY